MRAYLPAYDLKTPANLAEALHLLSTDPGGWGLFAGGTDLMVLLESAHLPAGRFLNLWNLPELRGIVETSQHIILGSLTTFAEIQRSAVLRREYPLLCQAASETGAVAIQNRATIGGNIANASPAADSPPALLVYDAELELLSANEHRWIPYQEFHTGYKQTRLQSGQLIAHIRLPRSFVPWKEVYRKVGTRGAQAISKVCFAGRRRMQGETIDDIRIAFGSVAPVPIRCLRVEALLRGQTISASTVQAARTALSQELSPIDDFRSTEAYRRTVAGNLLEHFLLSENRE